MKRIIYDKYLISVGFFLLIVAGASTSFAQVSLDGVVTSNAVTSGATISFNHTTGTGISRLMLVGVSWNCSTSNQTITSITFKPNEDNAISLTMVRTQEAVSGFRRSYSAIYSLINPPNNQTGTITITFSASVSSGIVAGAANFAGVDLLNPLGPNSGATGSSNTPSLTLEGLNNDVLVFDNVFIATNNQTHTLTAGDNQTEQWNSSIKFSATLAASSIEFASSSSITMNWTKSGNAGLWAIVAVAINPEPNTWLGTTSTDWHTPSNWTKGVPTSTGNVAIPQGPENQPIISTPIDFPNQEAFAQSVRINPDASLTLDPTGKATFTSITNNGTLNLNSTSIGTASLMVDSYTGINANIELCLSPNYWHYISSPTNPGLSSNDLAAGNDLAQFVESLPLVDPPNWQRGWVAWNGWSYDQDTWDEDPENDIYYPEHSFSTLALGRGFNYWNESSHTFSFSGGINTDEINVPIDYSGDLTWSGYNLVGNPYTCGIDIQALFDHEDWLNALTTVYFTINDIPAIINYDGVTSITVPLGIDASIPPMTGFFVKATDVGGNIPFPWSARTHSSTPRYKGTKSSIPIIRLSVTENNKSDETVIRFNEKATAGLDINFDAPRFMPSTNSPSIYSSVNGADYTINGLPFPESSVEIPITVKLLTDGNHVITAMEIQELANYKVSLEDKSTGSTVDLNSVKEYSFSASAGEIKDRFVLTVTSNISTAIEDPVNVDNLFNIYSGFDLINIQPLSDQWDGKTGSIKLMDISGKTVRNQPNTEFMKNSLIQLPSPGNGIYFVEIRSGIMRYVGKVVVK